MPAASVAAVGDHFSGATARTVARNFRALITGEALARIIGIVIALRLARALGVDGFGTLEVGLAVLVYLQLFVDGGLDLVATRDVTRQPALRDQYAGNLIGLRLATAATAVTAVLAINSYTAQPPLLKGVVLRYALSVVPAACALGWAFQASERMRAVAAGNVITQLVYLGGVLYAVRDGHGTFQVPLAYTLGSVVGSAAVGLWYVRRYGWVYPRFEPRFWRMAIKEALPVAGSRALRAVSFNFDVLMLGYPFAQSPVGLYAAAYRIVTLPLLGYATLFTALFPALVRLTSTEKTRFAIIGTTAIGASALIMTLVLRQLAAPLLTWLMGPAFSGGSDALRMLAWSIPLTAAAGVCRQLLLASGHQRVDLIVVACGAATNVILNILLIPAHGLIGAALATVSAEGIVLIGALGGFMATHAWPAAVAAAPTLGPDPGVAPGA